MKKINLFTVPYAFGGANIYRGFEKHLESHINIISLNYPGHEARISEKLLLSIQEMAEDVYKQIYDNLECEYSLLGYSMGGYICYELYQIIKKNNKKLPKYMFIFASNEPEYNQKYKNGNDFNLTQVREVLIEFGGTSNEIINNDDFIELIAPIVRNDITALGTYVPTSYIEGKIGCSVTVVRGSQEENIEDCQIKWNNYFYNECEYIVVNGKHFFMFEEDGNRFNEFAEIINKRI
jgi:medium-chain acyl-[acyl-carrier-protein] hydrolase